MSDTENNPLTEETAHDLKEEVACLRQQVWMLLVLALLVSGTLTIFLYRQDLIAKKDLDVLKSNSAPFVQQYQKDSAGMQSLMGQLGEYSKTHPDFTPIFTKYGITLNTNPVIPPK